MPRRPSLTPVSVTLLPPLPARAADAHKGDCGRVLIVGGARGMVGAVCLAARAAGRGGAGLVKVAVPESVWDVAAVKLDESLTAGLPDTPTGEFRESALEPLLELAAWADVVLLGPGASVHPQTVGLMRNAVSQILRPLVLDADALNAFAGPELGKLKAAQLLLNGPPEAATRAAETLARDRHLSSTIAGQEPRDEAGEADLSPASARSRPLLAFDPSSGARRPVVLLPHPGELARLLDTSIREVQRNRRRAARECVMETQCVVALKGAGTIVCDGSREYLNPSGNSGLATGGTGDVLAGLLAALLAQKLPPFEAACLAVYLHGLAGDLAAKRLGLWSMVAGDVLDELPQAFLLYSGQSAPSGT